jgi:MFS family permease
VTSPVENSKLHPSWWGSGRHIAYTLVVFVVLASLDNAALMLVPTLSINIGEELAMSDTLVGVTVGLVALVTALSSAPWGYWGDRVSRKQLLFWGTLIWAAGTGLTATATSAAGFVTFQVLAALGLGSVASVGFSVISDFVRPRRRGLLMSLWGLSQGAGSLLGLLGGSLLGADDFRRPFLALSVAAVVVAVLFLFAFEAPRGFREPALEALQQAGGEYEYRIDRTQIASLAKRRTNLFLVAQGLFAQLAYGSLGWVARLSQEKVLAEGYSSDTATAVGGLFATLFFAGGLFSILGGYLGDRWQRTRPGGRARLSSIGILAAIPFLIGFLVIPFRGLDLTDGAGAGTLIAEVLASVVTNGWVAASVAMAVVAIGLSSVDSPNWFALIADVNLPEHRGTVFGAGNLVNGIGRSIGNGVTPTLADALRSALPPPANWIASLALFQAAFVPSGYAYHRAAGTSPGDISAVKAEMESRTSGDSASG